MAIILHQLPIKLFLRFRMVQLYNLKDDIGEKNNLAAKYPENVKELVALLAEIRGAVK